MSPLFMIAIIGLSISLAAWFLSAAVIEGVLRFDRASVDALGVIVAVVAFAFAGPVMVLRHRIDGRELPRWASLPLAASWALLLGILANGLAASLLQPSAGM